ncbi:MAG: hypothetical protein JW748_04985 [Anaerolineales bacterium]|nr:hypothetical protein [Anaerolineales bacterium]
MAVAQKQSNQTAGPILEEIVHWIRSEPGLAWFAAQAIWMAQPALEIFWSPESISAIAEILEIRSPLAGETPAPSGEGGK